MSGLKLSLCTFFFLNVILILTFFLSFSLDPKRLTWLHVRCQDTYTLEKGKWSIIKGGENVATSIDESVVVILESTFPKKHWTFSPKLFFFHLIALLCRSHGSLPRLDSGTPNFWKETVSLGIGVLKEDLMCSGWQGSSIPKDSSPPWDRCDLF